MLNVAAPFKVMIGHLSQLIERDHGSTQQIELEHACQVSNQGSTARNGQSRNEHSSSSAAKGAVQSSIGRS